MTPIVVSPRADADVDEMIKRLAEAAGPSVVRRYERELGSDLRKASGARRRSLGPNMRIAVLSPYVIVYDYVDGIVRIVRIVDGRRNITRRLVRE